MKEILRYLWHYRWRFLLGILALFLVDGAQLAIPLIVRQVVDELTAGSAAGLPRWAGYIVGLAFIVLTMRFLWRRLIFGSARRIERDLRERLYAHLLRLSQDFFTKNKTGELMAHATNDIDAVRMACGGGLLTLADALVMVSFSLAAMLTISTRLTLYAFAPLPLITLVVLGFGRVIHRRFRVVQEAFSALTERVREQISGIRVVKAFAQEEGAAHDFARTNREFVRKNMHLVRVWGLFNPLIAFLAGLSTAIVLWLGGQSVLQHKITLGDFVAFTSYLGMLTWPMMALGWMVNLVQRGTASMERIQQILKTEPAIRSPQRPRKLPGRGAIEFRRLSFAYDRDSKLVLRDINLRLAPGTTLGIIGLTGAGKSTLVRLLPRLYDPPPGTVFIDNIDVRDLELHELRRFVGMVPQDAFLFSTTIRENIAFGRPEATEEEIIRAAQLAGIWDEIQGFPNGLDTLVGERGLSLSGGQKQRVGIARALLYDPKILILDDALSAVDAQVEELILKNMRQVLHRRTAIIIAHRISAVKDADWIIVLEDGRISEQGQHEELIKQGGLYARLYELQRSQQRVRA